MTSAGTEAIAPGVWVTENCVLPCQRTPERNPEAGEANTLPVPQSFEVRAVRKTEPRATRQRAAATRGASGAVRTCAGRQKP